MTLSTNCCSHGFWARFSAGPPKGASAFTRMLSAAHSSAAALVSPRMASLADPYAACIGVPCVPAPETMLTTAPPPRAFMCGWQSCIIRNAAIGPVS